MTAIAKKSKFEKLSDLLGGRKLRPKSKTPQGNLKGVAKKIRKMHRFF